MCWVDHDKFSPPAAPKSAAERFFGIAEVSHAVFDWLDVPSGIALSRCSKRLHYLHGGGFSLFRDPKWRQRALTWACRFGDLPLAIEAVIYGACLDPGEHEYWEMPWEMPLIKQRDIDPERMGPLALAAKGGHLGIFRMLIRRGARAWSLSDRFFSHRLWMYGGEPHPLDMVTDLVRQCDLPSTGDPTAVAARQPLPPASLTTMPLLECLITEAEPHQYMCPRGHHERGTRCDAPREFLHECVATALELRMPRESLKWFLDLLQRHYPGPCHPDPTVRAEMQASWQMSLCLARTPDRLLPEPHRDIAAVLELLVTHPSARLDIHGSGGQHDTPLFHGATLMGCTGDMSLADKCLELGAHVNQCCRRRRYGWIDIDVDSSSSSVWPLDHFLGIWLAGPNINDVFAIEKSGVGGKRDAVATASRVRPREGLEFWVSRGAVMRHGRCAHHHPLTTPPDGNDSEPPCRCGDRSRDGRLDETATQPTWAECVLDELQDRRCLEAWSVFSLLLGLARHSRMSPEQVDRIEGRGNGWEWVKSAPGHLRRRWQWLRVTMERNMWDYEDP